MRHGGGGRLVDQPARPETLQGERRVDPVRLVAAMVWAKTWAEPGVALNPPVPQPQLT